jgi:hypothetical protein
MRDQKNYFQKTVSWRDKQQGDKKGKGFHGPINLSLTEQGVVSYSRECAWCTQGPGSTPSTASKQYQHSTPLSKLHISPLRDLGENNSTRSLATATEIRIMPGRPPNFDGSFTSFFCGPWPFRSVTSFLGF